MAVLPKAFFCPNEVEAMVKVAQSLRKQKYPTSSRGMFYRCRKAAVGAVSDKNAGHSYRNRVQDGRSQTALSFSSPLHRPAVAAAVAAAVAVVVVVPIPLLLL